MSVECTPLVEAIATLYTLEWPFPCVGTSMLSQLGGSTKTLPTYVADTLAPFI